MKIGKNYVETPLSYTVYMKNLPKITGNGPWFRIWSLK